MATRHFNIGQYISGAAEKPYDEKSDFKTIESENNNSVIASLQKILLIKAETCEEKFKILDARDKLYKLLKFKDPSVKRNALLATCPDMCPEKERLLREYQNRGSIFEMTNYSKTSGFNHALTVKEYARSSADQEEPLPHELRPIHVLSMTMSHLLHNVSDFCELSDDNLEDWYMFMWDRTRALRKELTQQGVCCKESVTLVEQCARFHIHCAERLVDQDSSIYDDKINTENLTKCLQTLKYMYKDLAKEDIKCPNEPEFIAYTLLLNLNNSSVFTELSDMSETLMASNEVKLALNIMTTWETRNYIRFFNLVKNTTYLNCCLLRRYFGEMRLYAIKTMIRSYCTKTYSPQIPIPWFVENLNFEGEKECINFLTHCNFDFRNSDGTTVVNFNRLLFQNPQSTVTNGRAYLFIEEKKTTPLSMVLAGGTLPAKLYENHVLENSFNENGELKKSALLQFDLMEFSCAPPVLPNSGSSDAKTNKTDKSQSDFYPKERQDFYTIGSEPPKSQVVTPFSSRPLFPDEAKPPTTSLFSSIFGSTTAVQNVFNKDFSSKEDELFNVPKKESFLENCLGALEKKPADAYSSGSNAFAFGFKGVSNLKFTPISKDVQSSKVPEPMNEISKSDIFSTGPSLQFKFEVKPMEGRTTETEEKSEKFETEQNDTELLLREKNDEENRKRKLLEEEEEKLRIEKKIMLEETHRKEVERKEKERRENEEKLKRERQALLEREEKRIREENERQEKLLRAHLKEVEENKRKELEYKQKVIDKMAELKKKYQKWKTKIMYDKWRMITWCKIEERKMAEYFKEVKLKYPPVCTNETLNGNPFGLIIPSTLTFERFQAWRRGFRNEGPNASSKKLLLVTEELPLLKPSQIIGKTLESRWRSLGSKLDPFLWKLVISVPDELESPHYWKSVETFVEMHFVDDINWEFGVQGGPLYCRSLMYKSFKFVVSIRRFSGPQLYEGSRVNPSAAEGCNAVIFVVTEPANEVTRERCHALLKSKPPLPKVPMILFVLTDSPREVGENMKKSLDIEILKNSHISTLHTVSVVNGKNKLLAELIKCLNLAATHSAPPSSLRMNSLSAFFNEVFLDSLWRRLDISLGNFKIILKEPKILIECYNSCLERLIDIFLDDSYHEQTVLAPEFFNVEMMRPKKSPIYEEMVKSILKRMKLPHWPVQTPKSCHQLNYRIHQYCKKLVGNNKLSLKNFKWRLYRTIRRSLLWKGLDIYCEEDINEILINFPWVEVFQEISRVHVNHVISGAGSEKDLIVVYDIERIEGFSFESSLIESSIKRGSTVSESDDLDESGPCLEKDSVVYAYFAALEALQRQSNKRKRDDCIDESIDALFSSPFVKKTILDDDEKKKFDIVKIEDSFKNLNDRLDGLKQKSLENASLLIEIRQKMQ